MQSWGEWLSHKKGYWFVNVSHNFIFWLNYRFNYCQTVAFIHSSNDSVLKILSTKISRQMKAIINSYDEFVRIMSNFNWTWKWGKDDNRNVSLNEFIIAFICVKTIMKDLWKYLRDRVFAVFSHVTEQVLQPIESVPI